jgi:hypothetical protein
MEDEIYHSYDNAIRVPKEIYAVMLKGRDPQTNRMKTWVRVHTSKTDARKAAGNWIKHKFGDVKLMKATTIWEEMQ